MLPQPSASLNVLVPSRGRPENVARLISAMDATMDLMMTRLFVIVDEDDPKQADYQYLLQNSPHWAFCITNSYYYKIGPILNAVSRNSAKNAKYIAFMGDDHCPRTYHWDQHLVEALDGKPGVSYGNDLFQGDNLPTAVCISSDVIRALGYMCPPGLEHLYLDNFWKELGQRLGNLKYLPDVIIEHLHPLAGKAEVDAGYQYSLASTTLDSDGRKYAEFLIHGWPRDSMTMMYNLANGVVAS
jgi:hypothetical protein